ncbi:MAG TPA: TonB-dependent receptor plug domain-containing protein, partial [Chitinophagaceae bacterium]|nr:TonB-dependent receptor plug domain-containing protein [Chitinophagaceae bacterium]
MSGRVLTSAGRVPLPDASVTVKGKNVSVSTGDKGEFTIAAAAGSVLEITHVGYRKKEVAISNQQNITILLEEQKDSLDDVVVIGYGRVKKRDLTGSVSSIKSEAFANVPVASIDQMLQGKAAGMEVTSISGQPGDGTTIRIRGGNSINGSNEPLYVVDGILAGDGFNTNLINPEDVESIEILKDASSTAIYGARGSNGVIIITTKTGKPGRDRVSVGTYTGFQEIPHLIPMMNGKEYGALVNEQYIAQGKPAYYTNLDTLANTD